MENSNDTKVRVNILPFLAEAFSTNKRIYKKINEIYNTDSDKFYTAAKENEFYNHKIGTDGNIEQEYFFKKSLGILIVSSSDIEVCDKVVKLMEYGWKYPATYVNTHKFISLEDFIPRYIKKNHGLEKITDDELNSTILVTVVLATYKGIEVDLNDNSYTLLIKSFSLRLEKSKKGVSLSLDNFTNDYRNKIKKLERKLNERNKSLYMPLGSNAIMQSNIKDDFYYDISALNLNEKFLLALEYVYELEGICLISTVGNDIFKSKDIQELLLCYTIYFSEEEIDNIDITELEKFIAVASQIRYLCRSYKKAKKFFFDNFQEELQKENSSLKAKAKELKIKYTNLLDASNTTNQRLEELIKENNRLKAQLEEEKANKKELIALREYIFNNSEENDDVAIDNYSNNIDIDYIDNIKGVIIGGKPNWLLKMRKKLPSWTLIDPSSINFDKNILNNEHIFINTSYISHAMYYKVVENLGKNSNIHYINNTNIEICLEDIYNIISS